MSLFRSAQRAVYQDFNGPNFGYACHACIQADAYVLSSGKRKSAKGTGKKLGDDICAKSVFAIVQVEERIKQTDGSNALALLRHVAEDGEESHPVQLVFRETDLIDTGCLGLPEQKFSASSLY